MMMTWPMYEYTYVELVCVTVRLDWTAKYVATRDTRVV